MECKITSTKARQRGALLSEYVFAVAIATMVLTALASFSLYSARAFVMMENYVDLGDQARWSVDRMSQEIRMADKVTAFDPANPSRITVQLGASSVTYAYNAAKRTLERTFQGATSTMLRGCDSVSFGIFTRQATNSTYETFPVATLGNAKIVQVTWNCSRTIFGRKQNTEAMQTAQVVIRKQGK